MDLGQFLYTTKKIEIQVFSIFPLLKPDSSALTHLICKFELLVLNVFMAVLKLFSIFSICELFPQLGPDFIETIFLFWDSHLHKLESPHQVLIVYENLV
jgi:hypothetical protein